MALRTDKLYLIEVRRRTVAIISAKTPLESIRKYVERTGFASNYRYLCCGLMTSTVEVNHTIFTGYNDCLIIKAVTKTIDNDYSLRISSQQVRSCDGIFSWIDPKDINDWLFIRPTIEEVRKCVGFSREPMYKLRKFCI